MDSEVMYGLLEQRDFELVDEPEGADVIVINTCAFIQPATEESLDTVLEMARFKEHGSCRKLIVTGCMVQRYKSTLEDELPEVDHFLGTGEYHRVAELLSATEAPRTQIGVPTYLHDELVPRSNSWSAASAYLKIGEGCNHKCSFCLIPGIRGRLRSRTIPSLVAEASRLAEGGVVEFNLVSQDSTAYGRDLPEKPQLAALLSSLAQVDGIEWIRLHYAYPLGLPEGLLDVVQHNIKVCKYLDMPLQHVSGHILRSMRRGVTPDGQRRILERIRRAVPDIAVRTTFIVGYPGETDRDFRELCDFVHAEQFDHVGVFPFYAEEGSHAAGLPDQVAQAVKEERQQQLMEIQRVISHGKLGQLVGHVVPVLVEGTSSESDLLLSGRMASQAPEVDGQVFITSAPPDTSVGQIRPLLVEEAGDYDIVGELLEHSIR
ncbi:MAG: 30S ribosomal protein S12 methylthiotransferase RimO [Proteobacteria bacterium]|nr:30S ribosomal protein S12 methylthiotransferase RimO [Pseudomonadota bacterium]